MFFPDVSLGKFREFQAVTPAQARVDAYRGDIWLRKKNSS